MRRIGLVCATAVLVSVGPAGADQPLPPPAVVSTCSPNGRFCATADPRLDTVVVHRGGDDARRALWSKPGWERVFQVSDSGNELVACYSGGNLLALDAGPSVAMLRFYGRGQLVRQVSLAELIPDRSKLQRTVSHYAWGNCVGFNAQGQFEVRTADRGLLRFDASTGVLLQH